MDEERVRMVTNEEKARVWEAYNAGRPVRVPVRIACNPRVVILDEKWNPGGVTFEEYFQSAKATAAVQTRFMDYRMEYLAQYCDDAVGRPTKWTFYVDTQNIYDAAYFGAPIEFREEQLPDTTPILVGKDKEKVFEFDVDHPMENPFIKTLLRRWEELKREAAKVKVDGVEFTVQQPMLGFDGHLTIATCLRGAEIFSDFYEDPGYVRRLLEFIHKAVVKRNRAVAEHLGQKAFDGQNGGHADDSIALISGEMYREFVMEWHRKWYGMWGGGPHSIHLCGDATRHFKTIHEELNVGSFDTGFPVDHGWLREELGEDVTILGGPEVGLLAGGTEKEVYERTREILRSGVMRGGKFRLREANNLPPRVPEGNLRAMYESCLENGRY